MNVKEFAKLGGKARAAALTKERRIEIARNAGLVSARNRKACKQEQESCQSDDNGENKSK